jgi:hypothetical protein
VEDAERRIKPTRDLLAGGEIEEIIAQSALSNREEVRYGRERIRLRRRPSDEESVSGGAEKRGRIGCGNEAEHSGRNRRGRIGADLEASRRHQRLESHISHAYPRTQHGEDSLRHVRERHSVAPDESSSPV